jgi:peptide-methionine (S)-S-oxide reductase
MPTIPPARSTLSLYTALAAGLSLGLGALTSPLAARPIPLRATGPTPGHEEVVVLSGGCFWGIQAVFEHMRGVTQAVSGYTGGDARMANYDDVSTGTTGHAESVRVTFDPAQVSFADILHVFFTVAHDPTELNRQGPDDGSQYRSAIWYTSEEQKRAAEAYIAQLTAAKTFPRPIVTQLAPLHGFYPAESYHQDYFERHPDAPYIAINDRPKVEHLRELLPTLYREVPVLTTASGRAS